MRIKSGLAKTVNRKLLRDLKRLHRELSAAKSRDERERTMLQKLITDIEQFVQRDDNEPHHWSSLRERLTEALAQLEVSHPQVNCLCDGHLIPSRISVCDFTSLANPEGKTLKRKCFYSTEVESAIAV